VLAHHFELGRDFAKAVRYLTMAAESSSRRFSSPEAANYLSRALELVSHLSDDMQVRTRLKLLLLRAWAWRAGGNFVRSVEDLRAIIAHAAGHGLLREEVNARVDLSRFVLYLDPRQSVPLAEQALSKSLAIDDPAFRALVRGNAANLRMMLKGWTAEDAAFARQAAELIGDSEDLSMRRSRNSERELSGLLRSRPARQGGHPPDRGRLHFRDLHDGRGICAALFWRMGQRSRCRQLGARDIDAQREPAGDGGMQAHPRLALCRSPAI